MSLESMNPTYEPEEIEGRWYSRWEDAGLFRPEFRPDGRPFSVVIPPPNVTGSLHMGHALNHTIHDVIVRRKRMQGYAAVWIPGTDHAGIATQNVVERELAGEGLTRHDLGREAFLEQVWEWKRKYGDRITTQIRRMGNSPDWTRERFTMDEGLSRAVREVFVRLYEQGLLYRGNRIINWCPRCATALAEIEVEYDDVDGSLTHVFYPFAEGDGGITVATTRPETMLGDTGVAVHPDDERYREAIGRNLRLPLIGRLIPVVGDDAVDPAFGSGAVKVTPAHDPTDFEIGLRHGLATVVVLDEAAIVTEEGGRFVGMDRFEAREAVRAALDEGGFLVKVESHRHSVGHCYRCRTIVEPYLSLQWFVATSRFAQPSIDAVRNGANRFIPGRWEKSYFHWMENLRDWCISRQIWWGHRIPAWYCSDGHVTVARQDPAQCAGCGRVDLVQDEDVLDTWFSSALWPFSTLGWPEQTPDLERFYPNSVLITGFDIIYFWVARMMQMGLQFMGETPFSETVIHGLVRDAEGNKMSKSKGNTIDPLDLVAEYGADPLRLALIQAANPGQDVPLDVEWVRGTRKFGNKLWNATRFVLRNVQSVPAEGGYPTDPGPADAWILSRLGETVGRFDQLCDEYRFSDAFGLLYNFAWSEVFDWYLEISKVDLGSSTTNQTLGVVMRDLLKLFHPAMPFVTEELWSYLVGEGLVAGSDWPVVPSYPAHAGMETTQELISSIRRFRAEQGIAPRRPLSLLLVDPAGLIERWAIQLVSALAAVEVTPSSTEPASGHTRVPATGVQAFIALEGIVDIDAERARLDKALQTARADMERIQGKLENPEFTDKAPAAVVEKARARRLEIAELIERIEAQLEAL